MFIRQLFDYDTYTYTYLLADEESASAALIDPVSEKVDSYILLLKELNLSLVAALDTHIHADHITALGALRARTPAQTFIGDGNVTCADKRLQDKQVITVGNISINVIYTPGHTSDSFSFYVKEAEQGYLFSGDTLLIRGTGRTDFQNGSAESLYDSLHQKLLTLPEDTIIYPGHDYRGCTKSVLKEEVSHNPRLQILDKAEFVAFMGNLKLPNPKFMDVAVPANLQCGKGTGPGAAL